MFVSPWIRASQVLAVAGVGVMAALVIVGRGTAGPGPRARAVAVVEVQATVPFAAAQSPGETTAPIVAVAADPPVARGAERPPQEVRPGIDELLGLLLEGDPVTFAALVREWVARAGAVEVGRLLEVALGADSGYDVQDFAWALLADVAGPDLAVDVARLVGSPFASIWMRGWAVRVLSGIAERHPSEVDAARLALLPLLGSGHDELREAAARALGRIGAPPIPVLGGRRP